MEEALIIAGSFIAGAIPFGWIYVRLFKKLDIRTIGSGNTGATNVYRVAGFPAALLVFFLDFMKGFLPVFFWPENGPMDYYVKITIGIAAVMGHNFSIFLKGRGGKGVATSAGVATALAPLGLLLSFAVFALVFAVKRIISLSSLIGALAFPLFCFLLGYPLEVRILSIAVFVFILFSHRKNIQRLFQGEEKKIKKI